MIALPYSHWEGRNKDICLKAPHRIGGVRTWDACMTSLTPCPPLRDVTSTKHFSNLDWSAGKHQNFYPVSPSCVSLPQYTLSHTRICWAHKYIPLSSKGGICHWSGTSHPLSSEGRGVHSSLWWLRCTLNTTYYFVPFILTGGVYHATCGFKITMDTQSWRAIILKLQENTL